MSQVVKTQGEDTCPQHGLYQYVGFRMGINIIGNVCPICSAERSVHADEVNKQRDLKIKEVEWKRKIRAANIPEAFEESTFEKYIAKNAAAQKMLLHVTKYASHFDRVLMQRPASGLVFSGVPGTGKTHIACSIILELIRLGHSAAYLSCPQFLLAAREAKSFTAEEPISVLLEKYISPRLLVLDEFGAHTTQDSDYQNLYAVIDGRYQRNLPTIMVTNLQIPQKESAEEAIKRKEEGRELPPTDTSTTVDPRIIERIHGSGNFTFSFDWPGNRGPAPKTT